jgi:hypothetical protein
MDQVLKEFDQKSETGFDEVFDCYISKTIFEKTTAKLYFDLYNIKAEASQHIK